MNWKEFFRISRAKVIVLLIITVGFFINPATFISFFTWRYYAATLTPSEYGNKIVELGGSVWYNLLLILVNIIYWYLLSCFIFWIYNKVRKK